MASASAVRAGSAFVEFFLEDGKLQRGLKQTEARLRQAGTRMRNSGAAMVAGGLAGLTALAFPFAKLAEFDDAIRAVGAVTQASGEDLKSLEKRALELGRTTSFTAVEVANLMTELGRAGFKTDEINAMTGAVMDLSRATGTDAALSAGIMAATLRQFNMGASEATRVANILTVAANSTFNTVEGLGESLAYAGPVAADLGMSLEDTVAVLGSLGNVGIQGSAAGTALRRLGTVTAAEAEKLNRIFGVTFKDAAGNARPMVDVLGEIGEATADLPTAERAEKFNEAFGLLGITSASVISKASGATKDLAETLRGVTTEAADAALAMDAGPGGGLRRLASAFEGFQLAVGDILDKSGVTDFVEKLTGMLGRITEIANANPILVQSFLAVSAVLTTAGAILISLGTALQVAAFAAGGLSTALALLNSTGVISTITFVTSQLGAMGVAAVAAKVAVGGLAAYGIYKIAKAIYEANPALKAYNAQLELMAKLSGKNNDRIGKQQQKTLAFAESLKGEEREKFLKAQLERAKKELAGKEASLKGQGKVVEGLDTTFNNLTGNKLLESERKVLADIEMERDAAESFVDQLQSALEQTDLTATVAPAATGEPITDPMADFADPFAAFADTTTLGKAGLTTAGALQGGLMGVAVDALTADAPPLAPPMPDEDTLKMAADAGMMAGFGLMGGLSGVMGAVGVDEGLQEGLANFEKGKEEGVESVVQSNKGVDVKSAEGQSELLSALFGFSKADETVSAVQSLEKTLVEEEERNRRLARSEPRLRVSKTS